MNVRFDSEAEAELRDAIVWYERERAGLGDDFWVEVRDVVALIEKHHEIGGRVGRVRVRGVARRVPIRRFVVYRVRGDIIEIVAIAHQSRRPGYWRSRGA